jgi:hypothetical protein
VRRSGSAAARRLGARGRLLEVAGRHGVGVPAETREEQHRRQGSQDAPKSAALRYPCTALLRRPDPFVALDDVVA